MKCAATANDAIVGRWTGIRSGSVPMGRYRRHPQGYTKLSRVRRDIWWSRWHYLVMTPAWTPPRFDELFHGTAAQVRAFLRRHADPGDVDDLLVETFAVAWTRLDQVPERPLPWLLTVARHMAQRHWRTRRRASELQLAAVRAQWTSNDAPSPEAVVLERDEALAALEQCSELEREALLLTAWDGLSAAEGARVAGCSTRAFTVRLSRARARFNRVMGADPPAPRVVASCTSPTSEQT